MFGVKTKNTNYVKCPKFGLDNFLEKNLELVNIVEET